jgi:hypothetical protein
MRILRRLYSSPRILSLHTRVEAQNPLKDPLKDPLKPIRMLPRRIACAQAHRTTACFHAHSTTHLAPRHRPAGCMMVWR